MLGLAAVHPTRLPGILSRAGSVSVLSTNNIESELSYAYLHAVASRAGIICEWSGRHTDQAGVDAVLRVRGRLAPDSRLTMFTAEVQLKATKSPAVETNGRLSYSLKLKNYNELRSDATSAPQVLVVLFLPPNAEEWLTHNEERLVAQRRAYWVSLLGAPPSANQTSETIYLPRANCLSVANLTQLMTRFSRLEKIPYAP